MATKKKAKKSKKKSKAKVKRPVVKKTKKAKKKVVKKKAAARKPAASKRPAPVKKPVAPKPAIAVPQPAAAPAAMPGEERIGIVTHYYNHLQVAIIQLETGTLRTGDMLHFKGHTSDFRQTAGSMEVNHVHLDTVQAGSSFGLRVNEHAREHDVVYRVTKP